MSVLQLDPDLPPARLALAHARRGERAVWEGYFALEKRLSEAGARTSQPIMAQLRLAWWRDRFRTPCSEWPVGEPLLAALAPWDSEREALAGLVDGWEALLVGDDNGALLGEARVEVMRAMARLLGEDADDAVARSARDWLAGEASGTARLPRTMRPLGVLRALSLREAADRAGLVGRLQDALTLGRIALLGR